MPALSTLNRAIQLGLEATPGTSVPATRRLQSMSFDPTIKVETDPFRPNGATFNSSVDLTKEWTESPITGKPNFNELPYLLAGAITKPVTTTPDAVNAPTLRRHTFTPSNVQDDDPQTYTLEVGNSDRAGGFSHGVITEFGIAATRDSVEISGAMFGGQYVDDIEMTDTGIIEHPIANGVPGKVNVYVDTTHGALGTTLLERDFSVEVKLSGRYNPVWALNAAQPSFVDFVKSEPELTGAFTLMADDQGMDFLEDLRGGETLFLRLELLGDQVGSDPDNRYRIWVDLSFKYTDLTFGDSDGVFSVDWALSGVHDTGWGKALEVSVFNEITSYAAA